MSDEPKYVEDADSYRQKIVKWAMYAGAILALSVASALAQRWLGKPVELPPPPVILIQQDAEGYQTVTVIHATTARQSVGCPCDFGEACTCGAYCACPNCSIKPKECCK